MPDLTIDRLTKRFGGIVALDEVSFGVDQGEIVGLIGPNGAGKTTVFNCISRFYDADGGAITFSGTDVLRLHPDGVLKTGIGRTFQHAELFKTMPVLDNLMVGLHRSSSGFRFTSFLPLPARLSGEADVRRRALEIVEFAGLAPYIGMPAGALPFGLQKRVDLARALVSGPRLVMLDEPAAGLGHEELQDLADLIRNIRKDLKVTVLLVEHHMSLVMDISDRVVVLDFGKKIAEGAPADVQQNPEVIRAYLGTGKTNGQGNGSAQG